MQNRNSVHVNFHHNIISSTICSSIPYQKIGVCYSIWNMCLWRHQ